MQNETTGSLPDASWATRLPRERIPAVLGHLASLQSALTARLIGDGDSGVYSPTAPEWNLSIDDMMRLTGKTRRWLFAHKRLPFIRVISRKTIVGDEALLKQWIADRRRS